MNPPDWEPNSRIFPGFDGFTPKPAPEPEKEENDGEA